MVKVLKIRCKNRIIFEKRVCAEPGDILDVIDYQEAFGIMSFWATNRGGEPFVALLGIDVEYL